MLTTSGTCWRRLVRVIKPDGPEEQKVSIGPCILQLYNTYKLIRHTFKLPICVDSSPSSSQFPYSFWRPTAHSSPVSYVDSTIASQLIDIMTEHRGRPVLRRRRAHVRL